MSINADYREIIQRRFEERCARNRGYSLRAFARDLGLSAGNLSLILNGKQGISPKAADLLAKRLGLSPSEQTLFVDLVASRHARSVQTRARALDRVKVARLPENTVGIDSFQAMADWYHLAILELTQAKGFQSSPQWIANALDLSLPVVKAAIKRLKRLEMLEEKDGKLNRTLDFFVTPSGIPSDAIKKFHSQILKKAEDALHFQSVEERDFSTMVFAVAAEDIAWAKDQLKEFRRAFTRRLESNPRRDRLYALSLQLFALQSLENQENEA